MLQLKIISIGKTKEVWLDDAMNEYFKRLKPYLSIEFIWAKDDAQLTRLAEKEPGAVGLDANGTLMNSEDFSVFFYQKMVEGGSRMAFVIGGADGLPGALKKSLPLMSFSRLTFTHQIVRLLLVEQIYRAIEIAKGSKYHK